MSKFAQADEARALIAGAQKQVAEIEAKLVLPDVIPVLNLEPFKENEHIMTLVQQTLKHAIPEVKYEDEAEDLKELKRQVETCVCSWLWHMIVGVPLWQRESDLAEG